MVTEIRIYIEGGGDGRDTKAAFRMGFSQFFKPIIDILRAKRIHWNIIASGGRQSCYDDFINAIRSHPDAFNIMLVDSECEVTKNVITHLRERDNWNLTCSEDHCHLMSQTMEAWFVVDKSILIDYYGQGFNANAIPNTKDVETIPKAALYSALKNASIHTQKGEYEKIKHGADLLSIINPQIIRTRAKHCDRLFKFFETLVS